MKQVSWGPLDERLFISNVIKYGYSPGRSAKKTGKAGPF